MSRLIDADALFAEFENVGWYNNADRDEIAEPLILQAPTIDAVSVVRCAECRWSRPRTLKGETGYRCVFYRVNKAENGYCDIGEREGE